MKFDASRVQLSINTFKEGFLARLAHDLEFKVRGLELDIEGDAAHEYKIKASFDSSSLEVQSVHEADKAEIQKHLNDDVLKSEEFPQVKFVSTHIEKEGASFHITGELSLCGVTQPLSALAILEDGKWTADLEIKQSDFGIKPYSAMGGMMKVKDLVHVQIQVPSF